MATMDTHVPLVRSNTALYRLLDETISTSFQFLIDNDLLDPIQNGPKLEEIVSFAGDYDPEIYKGDLPDNLRNVVLWSLRTGTALEALGDLDSAISWYRAGQYVWRSGAHGPSGDVSTIPWTQREAAAIWQEKAGLCCALAGNNPHAAKLLTWAAQNRSMTEKEIAEEENAGYYQSIWQSLGFQIFSLTWLGDWPEVLRLAEIGMRVVEKTRSAGHPKDFREPQLLIRIGHAVATYYTSPNAVSQEAASNAITLRKIPDRDPYTRLNMLSYFFALIRKYPQLDPYPKLPSQNKGRLKIIADGDTAPATESDFQRMLDVIFDDAKRKRRYYIMVTSVGLHRRVGGYPGKRHQMALCLQVMRKNMGPHDRIFRQALENDLMEIEYRIPRPD